MVADAPLLFPIKFVTPPFSSYIDFILRYSPRGTIRSKLDNPCPNPSAGYLPPVPLPHRLPLLTFSTLRRTSAARQNERFVSRQPWLPACLALEPANRVQ